MGCPYTMVYGVIVGECIWPQSSSSFGPQAPQDLWRPDFMTEELHIS